MENGSGKHIILIGPPGGGKTLCGEALAKLIGFSFYDTDRLIESQQGCSISTIFKRQGEASFRKMESAVLSRLIALGQHEKLVVAVGAGLPVYNRNLDKLKELGIVVALSAALDVLVKRVKLSQNRPLLFLPDDTVEGELQRRLGELIEQRAPVYAQAGYKIDTSNLEPDEVASKIVRLMNSQRL